MVMSPEISIYDDGSMPGFMASKKITCEGLPTGKIQLIDKGRLVGLLANTYWVNNSRNTFGITEARSGFRFGGGGRHHRAGVGIHATNLIVKGTNPISTEELIKKVGNGLYIGRLWYLYPINLGSGDFTGTIVADSYIIENDRIKNPLAPNAVRLNDNWITLFKDQVIGVSDKAVPCIAWAAEEVVLAPEIAIKDMSLEEIFK
jgi:PmbA protein